MLTVPEAARRLSRNPETIRRWIRSGRLRAQRVGTQHLIDEQDLASLDSESATTPVPEWLRTFPDGRPQPDWVRLIREDRRSH
jgi:excisionase family DNA binding protein